MTSTAALNYNLAVTRRLTVWGDRLLTIHYRSEFKESVKHVAAREA